MTKFILLALSLLYLIVEYVFNVNLVHILGNDTIQNYLHVDTFGRFISSFGGTLIALRIISLSRKSFVFKSLVGLILLPLTFGGLYFSQEKILDIIAEKTPTSIKQTQAFTYAYKKGAIHDVLDVNVFFKDNEITDKEKTVFITSLSFWGFGLDEFIKIASPDYEKRAAIFSAVFSNDFKVNNYYYYKGYLRINEKAKDAYKQYRNAQLSSKNNKDNVEQELIKFWEVKKESEDDLISNYKRIRNKYLKNLKYDVISKSEAVYSDFYLLAGCGTSSCWNSILNNLNRKGISFTSNCEKYSKGNENSIYFKSDYLTSKTIKRSSKINNFLEENSFSCDVSLLSLEKERKQKVDSDIKVEYGISDFSFTSNKSFSQSSEVSKALIYMAKSKYDFILPSNWKRSDYNTFSTIYRNKYYTAIDSTIKDKMNKALGFSLPMNLNEDSFYSNKDVISFFDKKIGVYSNGSFKKDLSREQFYNYYKDHMRINLGKDYDNNISNPELLDSIFKMTILPIVGITFSLFFGLVNLVFILKEVICFIFKIEKKKNEYFVYLGLLFCFLIVPFFINNSYTSHKNFYGIYEPIKETSHTLAYFYKWFLNTEVIVYSLSDELLYEIPFKEINYMGR